MQPYDLQVINPIKQQPCLDQAGQGGRRLGDQTAAQQMGIGWNATRCPATPEEALQWIKAFESQGDFRPQEHKNLGDFVGGVVGGAAAGGALMVGVGILINSLAGGQQTGGAEFQGVGISKRTTAAPGLMAQAIVNGSAANTSGAGALATTTTTTRTTTKGLSGSGSGLDTLTGNIWVPLIALCVVCILGACCLAVAALIDPCGGRKVRRGIKSESVASVDTGGSDDDYYQEEYGYDSDEQSSYLYDQQDYVQSYDERLLLEQEALQREQNLDHLVQGGEVPVYSAPYTVQGTGLRSYRR